MSAYVSLMTPADVTQEPSFPFGEFCNTEVARFEGAGNSPARASNLELNETPQKLVGFKSTVQYFKGHYYCPYRRYRKP